MTPLGEAIKRIEEKQYRHIKDSGGEKECWRHWAEDKQYGEIRETVVSRMMTKEEGIEEEERGIIIGLDIAIDILKEMQKNLDSQETGQSTK